MPLNFTASTGAMELLDPDDNHIIWSSGRPLVRLMPSAAISLTGQSVVFPDFAKANAYAYDHASSADVCDAFITLLPQEWGPGLANDLSNATLGSVPSGTDYLDVRVKLSRTVAPSDLLGTAVPTIPATGGWVNCPGGSCPVELSSWARGFDVVLSGTSVLLRRFQSIEDAGAIFPWRADNLGGLAKDGWTHGAAGSLAPAAVGAASAKGIPAAQCDSKGVGAGTPKYRSGGSNPCSVSDTTNYGATYSVDFLITPGRYQS